MKLNTQQCSVYIYFTPFFQWAFSFHVPFSSVSFREVVFFCATLVNIGITFVEWHTSFIYTNCAIISGTRMKNTTETTKKCQNEVKKFVVCAIFAHFFLFFLLVLLLHFELCCHFQHERHFTIEKEVKTDSISMCSHDEKENILRNWILFSYFWMSTHNRRFGIHWMGYHSKYISSYRPFFVQNVEFCWR